VSHEPLTEWPASAVLSPGRFTLLPRWEGYTPLVRSLVFLLFPSLLVLPTKAFGQADASKHPASIDQRYLVIRSDDAGMSHSVNMALERMMGAGLPLSVSVMFACPWYQETAEILKRHPEVAVGIHLTLNSEWKNYRWGPVSGRSAVPSLVDEEGYFFATSEALHQHQPDLREVERELRAQIERARRTGLKIDYVDYHMGTVFDHPQFREIAERLAKQYGLGMMQYFGEPRYNPQYEARPKDKPDSLVALVGRLQPGFTVLVTHVGIDNAELGALLDMNTDGGLPDMSKNRQGELDALLSPRFAEAVKARDIRLITYRQLIQMQGLQSMRRPGGF
jgi:chitin disaccharide deacetylase